MYYIKFYDPNIIRPWRHGQWTDCMPRIMHRVITLMNNDIMINHLWLINSVIRDKRSL